MSTIHLQNSRMLIFLQSGFRDWWRQNSATLAYIIKVLIACLLAMWLSLRFELEQPRTAMMTVAIVMQSRAGMVFAKSYYRLLGTLVGIAVSFILVSVFAQERVLFLLCMALWIGFCTAGSMVYRNHQSYGFVLAGYTLCIVGLPATLNPELTFSTGVTRISEILIGLLCATVISDLIFPQRMWVVMIASVRQRFSDFSDLLRSVSAGQESAGSSRAVLLRFIGDIYSLESFRASTVMESDNSRLHRFRLSMLNNEFMEVSTSFHALEQLLSRQRSSGHPEVVAALLELYQPLGELFAIEGRNARNELEAAQIAAGLRTFRHIYPQRLRSTCERLPEKLHLNMQLDFDTGAELIKRFSDELQAYVNTYVSLAEGRISQRKLTEEPLRQTLHFDLLAVSLAGLRGTIVLLLMAAIWIFTDWPSGIEAITIGVISGTLFASSPSPTRTIKLFITGAAIGTVLAYFCNFQLLPEAQGVVMLGLAVSPPIILAAWITTRPAIAMIGAGIFIIYLSHVGFNSAYNTNPVMFMNEAIADFISILVSGAMYGLIDLSSSDWSRRRIARALRELVVSASVSPSPLPRTRLESAARDLVQRSGSTQRVAEVRDREVIDWLLSSLEIGHAVIALREQMKEIDNKNVLRALMSSLQHIANLYGSPSEQHRKDAISAINAAIVGLAETVLHNASRHQLRVTLHFINSALLDEKSVLAAPVAGAR